MNQAIKAMLGKRPEWFDAAACKRVGHLFYPQYASTFDERPAKKICASCPVMVDCFLWRIKARELGVWGHVDETEIYKFTGDYNETVIGQMNREELRAYVIRVAPGREPKVKGRPKRSRKREHHGDAGAGQAVERADGGGVPGAAGSADPVPGNGGGFGTLDGEVEARGEACAAAAAGGDRLDALV